MGNNYFAYMRISTREERGKQKYSRQEKALETYANKNNICYLMQFKDDASGKSFERKEWTTLEEIVKENDTIVFKDICRFTREAEAGYEKYMDLMNRGVNLVFLDNPTLSTDYIKNLLHVAEQQDLIAKVSIEHTVKLLLLVELDRAEKERLILSQRTKDGMKASPNKAGRKVGQLDKMSEDLRNDIIKYLSDRSIKGVDLMNKHNISRNTFKKYVKIVQEGM